jgi:hypothetical protein
MTCIDPECKGSPVERPDHSTWQATVYFCPTCRLRFNVPTLTGKLCGFAPTIIAGSAVVGLIGVDHDFGLSGHHGLGPSDTDWGGDV